MWELDCKESWVLKNWRLWTVVLEKTLESPLDSKESQSVHSKGNQSWIFFERADAEVETPVLWPPDAKNWLTGKDPWCWEILKAGEEDNRRWDGWMASPTQWTWVWVNPESWWWAGRPGVLQPMESQGVGHDCATKLNWIQLCMDVYNCFQWSRTPASIQPVFCDNCCICGCILDAFMETDTLHIPLLLCHLENPWLKL